MQYRIELGDTNGAVQIDFYSDGEHFLEVFDYSQFGGITAPASGCVILDDEAAEKVAYALLEGLGKTALAEIVGRNAHA